MIGFLYTLLFVGAAFSLSDSTVLIPDEDPFYDPPLGYQLFDPGFVLRDRTVSSGMLGVSAVQLLYRTTYTNGSAGATVATFFTGPLSFGNRVVAFSEPEDSVNTTCAPSYLFSTGAGSDFYSDIGHGLANGWTVVIADYEGPGSAFTAGRQAGYAVLDAIRAAFNYDPLGVSSSATVGAYGYSGGAIATGVSSQHLFLFYLLKIGCRMGSIFTADICTGVERKRLGFWWHARQYHCRLAECRGYGLNTISLDEFLMMSFRHDLGWLGRSWIRRDYGCVSSTCYAI